MVPLCDYFVAVNSLYEHAHSLATQTNTMNQDPRSGLPSASSFDADWECAGRQNLLAYMRENNIVAERDEALNELAGRGTRLHKAWETGVTLELKEDELEVYNDGVKLEESLVTQWASELNTRQLAEHRLEERYWLNDPDTMQPLLSGQWDRLTFCGNAGLLIDRKSGSGYYLPPANKSWQLRVYAVLAWLEFGVTNIRMAYVCPERFGKKLDYADTDEAGLKMMHANIVAHLRFMRTPNAPRKAGEHCRFCPAKAICKEAAEYATLPAVTKASTPALELVKAMTPEELKLVWQKKPEITKIFDAITARLSSLSDDELGKLGLKKTVGKKLDSINDVPGAFSFLVNEGIVPAKILNSMSMPKGEMVELIKARLGLSKKDAEVWWDTKLDAFIERKRGNPSLVEA